MARIFFQFPQGCALSPGIVAIIKRGIELVVADLFLPNPHPDILSEVCLFSGTDGIVIQLSDEREKMREILSGNMERRIRFICGVFNFVPASVTFCSMKEAAA